MSRFNLKKLNILCIVLSITACGGDSDTPSFPKNSNNAPVAKAGSDQFVKTLSIVTLNGGQSSDADGDQLTYKWSMTGKPTGSITTLSDANTVKPTFIPDVDGNYALALTVNDGTVDSDSDVVTIVAATENSKPMANAGNDQEVTTGDVVTLDGSQSSDADGDQLTYKWSLTTKPQDSFAALSDVNAVKPTFTPDTDGNYALALTVNDGTVDSDRDVVTITAATENSKPVANAGDDQEVATGDVVTLNGSQSSDADGDQLIYKWSMTTKPQGSSATLGAKSDINAVKPTFIADIDGNYVLALTVNDGTVDSDSDVVTITAATENSKPMANAGDDQEVATGDVVTLNGSQSSDADGDQLTYKWLMTTKPQGSSASLSDVSAVKPTFTPDIDGNYALALTVNDGTVDSDSDVVTITAATANSKPMANAGDDQEVATGDVVTLNGSQSSDADDDQLTYKWLMTTKPEGSSASLSDVSAVKPTFTPDVDGDYALTLIVNDGTVDSDSDVVTITAATENSKPVANAGNDQEVTTGDIVTLDGSQSSDADNDQLTYKWAIISKPKGSDIILSNEEIVKPTFTPDLDGDYVLSLTVSDGILDSKPSNVTVIAKTNPIINIFRYDNTNNFTPISWPNGWAKIIVKEPDYNNEYIIDTYKLQAVDQDFTIVDFYINDSSNNVIPFIDGIEDKMVIPKGNEIEFQLISPYKDGVSSRLRYQFKIKETGEVFNALYDISFGDVIISPPSSFD